MLYFVDTTRRDARKVIASLRQIDREEARVIHGITSDDEMLDLVMFHRPYTIKLDSTPVGLFGIAPIHNWAAPWLIGTEALTASTPEFLRASRPVFEQLIRPYDYITNAMLASNTVHRRWLRWLGVSHWEKDTHRGVQIVRFTACVSQLLQPLPPSLRRA